MLISEFLLLIIIYAIIQSALIMIYSFIYNKRHLSLFFLSLMIILGHYYYEHQQLYKIVPDFLWWNAPFWFLLAPTIYISILSILNITVFRWKDIIIHYSPFVVFVLIGYDFYFLTSGETKLNIYNLFYTERSFDYVQVLYLIQMLIYVFILNRKLLKKTHEIKSEESDSRIVIIDFVKKISLTVYAYVIVSMMISILTQFQLSLHTILYPLQFFILSLIVIQATVTFLKVPLNQLNIPEFSIYKSESSYETSRLSNVDKDQIVKKIIECVETDELYKNPSLRLKDISESIQIPSHQISQSLNQVLEKNFFEFINHYRIEDVKTRLKRTDLSIYSIEGIAQESGFKNLSSFYRVFKDVVGMTPTQFVKSETMTHHRL